MNLALKECYEFFFYSPFCVTGGVTSTDLSKTFTEEETVEAEKATDLYTKSRILAEKTAFEFIKELPGRS